MTETERMIVYTMTKQSTCQIEELLDIARLDAVKKGVTSKLSRVN